MRLGILGSTRGTNLQALYKAIQTKQLAAQIEIVISNKSDALILEKAHHFAYPAVFVDPQGLTRVAYDLEVSSLLKQHRVDLIILMGYMRILSADFVEAWKGRILNVHPSLLPKHAGLIDLAVHQAVLDAGETQSGCSVHVVTEGLDEGPVVIQRVCPVYPYDTVASLKMRVQDLEAQALIDAIINFNH